MKHFAPLFVIALFAGQLAADNRPNVVFILADDLGWADLGCYGSTYHKTPNLDRLAAEGMRFTNAYAACPVCSPTRASIMTGKYPQRLGITDWLPGRPDRPDQKLKRPALVTDLPASEVTLAAAFKKAGYITALMGKWHLGSKEASPEKRGFDVNIAGDHTGTALSYFAPFADKSGRIMPGLEKAPEGEYLTDRLAEEAVKFIEASRITRPFFLYLPHYAPHTPMKAKADKIAKYNERPAGQQGNPTYAAMVESLDDAVGRVMTTLKRLHLDNDTIVVFTSDNGGLATLEGMPTAPTCNAPLREGKGYLYEGGIRVPLIIKWPGYIRARTTDTPVCSIDFFPTLCEACGIKTDAKIDGLSLVPVLEEHKVAQRDLYWHYPHYANQGSKPGGAVRSGNYKLIEFYENDRRELFDVVADVGENKNLAVEKPEVVKQLTEKLAAWRKDVGAKMPTPNPDYAPNPQPKDGIITLPARTAEVHGTMLRFEPLPHKNTLGYWVNVDDWASWEFTVSAPGIFMVEVLQGCGKGQGGSEVNVQLGDQTLQFTVEDTGHFQNFKPRDIGTVKIEKPGRYTLSIKPVKKAASAIVDIRQVTLKPVK
jgi:arylsulfatase A-like enzyme